MGDPGEGQGSAQGAKQSLCWELPTQPSPENHPVLEIPVEPRPTHASATLVGDIWEVFGNRDALQPHLFSHPQGL